MSVVSIEARDLQGSAPQSSSDPQKLAPHVSAGTASRQPPLANHLTR